LGLTVNPKSALDGDDINPNLDLIQVLAGLGGANPDLVSYLSTPFYSTYYKK
jgi:hypothetical protein